MTNLETIFSIDEEQELKLWSDDKLIICSSIDAECYILNEYGQLTYEECFGDVTDEYLKKQCFERASPRRIIRYANFYLMEDKKELGHWFVGWMQKNGAIQFLAGHESLADALDSL
jgi:hypothetical protein